MRGHVDVVYAGKMMRRKGAKLMVVKCEKVAVWVMGGGLISDRRAVAFEIWCVCGC